MNKHIHSMMLEAGYAAPELAGRAQLLAELIVEHCAQRAEAYAYMSPNFTALAEELRSINHDQNN
jgi:hypothetical protein